MSESVSAPGPNGVSLRLVEHVEDLLGEPHGFGSLLFDTSGRLSTRHGRTWLYTTTLEDGRWTSWSRPFNLATRQTGPARRILVPEGVDQATVVHHVMELQDGRALAFYSNGSGVRAALAGAPASHFTPLEGFALDATEPWETLGKSNRQVSLEANGAYVRIAETNGHLEFWEGYDSYHRHRKRGDLGWARMRFEKAASKLHLIERHRANPLHLRPAGWACARCGGNLASDVLIGGQHAFFYYLRPDVNQVLMAVSLSQDGLFQGPSTPWIFDRLRGREALAEKFQKIQLGKQMLLFYESKLTDGSWRTGLRNYVLTSL
jgi:hypothetical protein